MINNVIDVYTNCLLIMLQKNTTHMALFIGPPHIEDSDDDDAQEVIQASIFLIL